MVNTQSDYLVEVEGLSKRFPTRGSVLGKSSSFVQALDAVSFGIKRGETLGLVGESGCGKTTLGKTLLRLIEPTSGTIRFSGRDITQLSGAHMQEMRRKMQIIFQDPYTSLNPRMSVRRILEEPLEIHGLHPGRVARNKRLAELLDYVQMPHQALQKYPHEFSGGQRQRISIARALAVDPEFIVCDESVSALDVSIQAQVINLLIELQEQLGLTYLFVAHDLKVVEFIAHRVAVMYLGKVVEMAPTTSLYRHQSHPYTHALLSAIPTPDPRRKGERIVLQGDIPSPVDPPSGCHFHPRCWRAIDRCKTQFPVKTSLEKDQYFCCWNPVEKNTS